MRTTSTSGYTFLELMIVLSILTAVLGIAAMVFDTSQRTYQQSVSNSMLNGKANRALNRISKRITGAGTSSLFPSPVAPFASDMISFREVVGWNDLNATWSQDVAIQLEYDPNELNNGIDDDDDGLVDEGQIVLIERMGQPDENRVVLASDVREFLEGEVPDGLDNNDNGLDDERGLCFELRGDSLVIRLTIQRRSREGRVDSRTLQTSVRLRN